MSETTTPPPPSTPAPSGDSPSPRRSIGRRPLIIAVIVVGVIIVAVAGILLITKNDPKPKAQGIGAGATPTEAKAMAMCGVVGGILEEPAAQVQPELGRRVQAILKVGTDSGDRYQATISKLSQVGAAGDTATVMASVNELQALCQPTQPTG